MCKCRVFKEIKDNRFYPGIHKNSDQIISKCKDYKSQQISGGNSCSVMTLLGPHMPLHHLNEFYPAFGYSYYLVILCMFCEWAGCFPSKLPRKQWLKNNN
jgi:hypothetical protein